MSLLYAYNSLLYDAVLVVHRLLLLLLLHVLLRVATGRGPPTGRPVGGGLLFGVRYGVVGHVRDPGRGSGSRAVRPASR